MYQKATALLLIGVMLVLTVSAVQASEAVRLGSSYISLANIYQDTTGFNIWRYEPDAERGTFTLSVTYDEIEVARDVAVAAGKHVLLEQVGDISFWVLTSGECQVNSPTITGETYEFVFGC